MAVRQINDIEHLMSKPEMSEIKGRDPDTIFASLERPLTNKKACILQNLFENRKFRKNAAFRNITYNFEKYSFSKI